MIVRLALQTDFYAAFPCTRTIYNTREFISLNASKAEAVRYFIGYDEDEAPRLGIVLGYRDGKWIAPFSAPFAEVAYDKPQSLERIYDFVSELADMLQGAPLQITLAPELYDPKMLPKLTGVLANYAPKAYYDYNYHYDLADFPQFAELLDRSARKNFKRALTEEFTFESTDDIDRAYAVIKANRESHGYPLAMSLEQVRATVQPQGPVKADFFILSHKGEDVAAAMVYHAAEGIVQVVYWGDAPGYNEMRPMNLLPYRLFAHYHSLGMRIVDIGPSSQRGIPSSGLCRFKENLGCRLSLKPTFVI